MKRIDKDGKSFRMRRGKLVEIPEEWVGKTTDAQTIRKRPSKQVRKLKVMRTGVGLNKKHPSTWAPRHKQGAREDD